MSRVRIDALASPSAAPLSGHNPNSLVSDNTTSLIAARLLRLAEGLLGDVGPIGDGVSELRIHHGPGYRVYFLRRGNSRVVLLCGGDKASQSRDIAKAKRLAEKWKDPDG